jgi:glutathione S-transferase
MIEFYAGAGPDTQAIGIALEEMFLDYRLMPGRAPVPVIAFSGARVVGAPNALMALARKTGRFLADAADVAQWLGPAPDLAALDTRLATSRFIAGDFSVADMAIYPRLAADLDALSRHSHIARWIEDMARRPAVGRGLAVVHPPT